MTIYLRQCDIPISALKSLSISAIYDPSHYSDYALNSANLWTSLGSMASMYGGGYGSSYIDPFYGCSCWTALNSGNNYTAVNPGIGYQSQTIWG